MVIRCTCCKSPSESYAVLQHSEMHFKMMTPITRVKYSSSKLCRCQFPRVDVECEIEIIGHFQFLSSSDLTKKNVTCAAPTRALLAALFTSKNNFPTTPFFLNNSFFFADKKCHNKKTKEKWAMPRAVSSSLS